LISPESGTEIGIVLEQFRNSFGIVLESFWRGFGSFLEHVGRSIEADPRLRKIPRDCG
jgi:hypothetical protein